jgi:hypothetical protein
LLNLFGDLKLQSLIPEGMNEHQDNCLQSERTIYGLIQITSEFYLKLILVLKSIGFVEKNISVFLLNRNGKEVILINIYADDWFCHSGRRAYPIVDC